MLSPSINLLKYPCCNVVISALQVLASLADLQQSHSVGQGGCDKDGLQGTQKENKTQLMPNFDVHPKQFITSFTIFFVFPHQLCVCKSFFNWSQICLNIHSLFLKNEMGVGRLTYGVNGLLSQFRGPPVKDSTPGQTNFKTHKHHLSHSCSNIA